MKKLTRTGASRQPGLTIDELRRLRYTEALSRGTPLEKDLNELEALIHTRSYTDALRALYGVEVEERD